MSFLKPDGDAIEKTAYDGKNETVFILQRKMSKDDIGCLGAGLMGTSPTASWMGQMSENVLHIYHRFYSKGRRIEYCLFSILIDIDSGEHKVVMHARPKWIDRCKSVPRILLDRWTGRYEQYRYVNSSGVFFCDEFGGLIHFAPTKDNILSAEEAISKCDWEDKEELKRKHDDCVFLEHLEIPEGVRSIGRTVDIYRVNVGFDPECFNFRNTVVMNEIVFPESLKVLDRFAFYRCSIKEMTIRKTLCALAQYAFGGCHIDTLTIEKRDALLDITEEELPCCSFYDSGLNLWLVGREMIAALIDHLRIASDYLEHGCTVACYNENHSNSHNGCRFCKALGDSPLRSLFREAVIGRVSIY